MVRGGRLLPQRHTSGQEPGQPAAAEVKSQVIDDRDDEAAGPPRRCRRCWPVNGAAIYGQEVEPPTHRQRLARSVPGGRGRSPDAADDTDVVEMGGRRPRWPWGS